MRDKQKEAPEGRSGRWRDCAAGAPGLPAGRPDAAGPGEWVGWGKGRELSPLKTHSCTPPASCPAPRAPAALARPARAGSLGHPAAIQLCPCRVSPFPRVGGTAPSPRRRGARAPSLAPRASCALLLGVSASAPPGPPGPLVIPWVPPDPHFCTRFPHRRVSTSGLSPYQLFFIFRGSPCSLLLGS